MESKLVALIYTHVHIIKGKNFVYITDKYTKSTKNWYVSLPLNQFFMYSIGYNYVNTLHTNLPLNINKLPQWPIFDWVSWF